MSRPLALSALLLVLITACGGSEGAEPNGGENAGDTTPADTSLVIYKDTAANVAFAAQPSGQRSWQFTRETDKDFLLAMGCTPDGNRAAYLMSTESGTRLKISGRPEPIAISGVAQGLTWAPDGSTIAVTTLDTASSAHRLELVDAQSGQISIVASGQGAIGPPRWSPDGSRIVFDAADGQVNQIFVYTVGGQGAAKLKERPGHSFGPDWSPDGSTLIFVAPGEGETNQIFKMNADGSNEAQVTTSNVGKAFPRWAPDGSLIAFAGTVIVPAAAQRPALVHNLAVFTVLPDGTDERALTDVATDARLGGWCVSGPWLAEDWREAG